MDNMGYLPSGLQCSNPPMPTMQSTVPEFDRFAKFSKVHIIKLLSEVENRIWSLALKGASDQVADRFFHLMESGQEEEIRTDFKLLCNVRRKDVEEAQRYILEKAKTKGGKGMYLKIHRGTKQIGGNIVEILTETTKIIFDCGLNLPPLDESFSKDTIQIDGLTVGESAYDAVFITHYHADHCGLVERVNIDIPIYMSNDTKVVLEIISDFIDSPRSHKYLASDIHSFSNAKTMSKITNLTFLVLQTMGEFLKRLNDLTPLAGSTLIYSMWRGYENKPQTQRFLDLCNSYRHENRISARKRSCLPRDAGGHNFKSQTRCADPNPHRKCGIVPRDARLCGVAGGWPDFGILKNYMLWGRRYYEIFAAERII